MHIAFTLFNVQTRAESFEAELCSFSELVNVEPSPSTLTEVYSRIQHLTSGKSNFRWEKQGLAVEFAYPLVFWYGNWDAPDLRTKANLHIQFEHDVILSMIAFVISVQLAHRRLFVRQT